MQKTKKYSGGLKTLWEKKSLREVERKGLISLYSEICLTFESLVNCEFTGTA